MLFRAGLGVGDTLGRDNPVPELAALCVQSGRKRGIVRGDGILPLLMNKHYFTLVLSHFTFSHTLLSHFAGESWYSKDGLIVQPIYGKSFWRCPLVRLPLN
jgi:hypothetical protein